jgi:hypothetical protein
MGPGPRHRAIALPTFVGAAVIASIGLTAACNALTGAADLGVCQGDDCAAAISPEAGSPDAEIPEASPLPSADSAVEAGPAAQPFGTGRSGPLAVPAGASIMVNAYAAITAPVTTGSTAIPVGDATMFGPDDLVLVWQTSGLTGVVSGAQPPVALAPTSVGHFEIVRVASVSAGQIVLAAPLASSYPAVSQVVRLPEFTDVTIPQSSQITAMPWDGAQGGIVAFLATGAVEVSGAITTDALGFRGGIGFKGSGLSGCAALDGEPIQGYAAKGEGIARAGYTTVSDGSGIGGRGNLANGAGGGVCHNGGGAGGGHGGSGGPGGLGMNGNALGGLGGSALQYAPLNGLLMGGGGAAGDDNNGDPLPSGGAGGGAIFVRAHVMSGSGSISARGAPGVAAPANDGSGGGGAGGGIVIVAETSLASIALRAEGGSGGNAGGAGGGGGGGGVVDVSTSSFQSNAVVAGGAAGGLGTFASGPGAAGRFELRDGG